MSHVFQPMPAEARAAFVPHYLSYLRDREGAPDMHRRTLPKREAFFSSLAPIPLARPLVDQAVFDRNVRRRVAEPGLDGRTRWALAVAKVNRAERFGVELKLRQRGFERGGADDPYTFIEIQELYHSRIFVSILRAIGVVAEIDEPAGITRAVVSALGALPHLCSDVLALAAEVAGVAAFRLLLEEARRLFADEPAVLARIEMLFGQILVDEVGHVAFLRSRLGSARLALARAALPVVTRGMLDDIAELADVLGRERYLAEVARADVESAVTSYPDRLPALGAAFA